MKVAAKVLYEDIREYQAGIYCWLDPDEESLLILQRLMRHCPFKTENLTKLHTTVLYCKGPIPLNIQVPEDRPIPAELSFLEIWKDHEDDYIVVGRLVSDELQDLHKSLVDQGLKHSFDDYAPHITLAKGLKLDAAARLWIDQRNRELREESLYLWFAKELKGCVCD